MKRADGLDVRITDTCLRDGSHAKRHAFTEEHVRSIVRALDAAGMPVVEVSHGDGLGGSSFNYGFSLTDERKLIAAAVSEARRTKIAALMLPGLGTKDDIRVVRDLGVSIIRIAMSPPIEPPATYTRAGLPNLEVKSPTSWCILCVPSLTTQPLSEKLETATAKPRAAASEATSCASSGIPTGWSFET